MSDIYKRHNYVLFSGVVEQHVCEGMIAEMLKVDPVRATTFSSDSEDLRRSNIRWVSGTQELWAYLLRFINIANAEMFNVDIQQELNEMQFTEYSAEDRGMYTWHHDVDWENPMNYDRKLSLVVQLSDPNHYEGGEFSFKTVKGPDQSELKMQGSVLVFPSYLEHSVSEVTEGKRYSLVSWVRGPRWR